MIQDLVERRTQCRELVKTMFAGTPEIKIHLQTPSSNAIFQTHL